MTYDTFQCETCEICMFGSLLVTLLGALILFVVFRIDMNNNDVNNNSIFNVGLVIFICYLVGIYIKSLRYRRCNNDSYNIDV